MFSNVGDNECEAVVIALKSEDEVSEYCLPLVPVKGGIESVELLGTSVGEHRTIILTTFKQGEMKCFY